MARLVLTTILVYIAVLALRGSALGTNATCQAEYDWMANSLGQSPCLVNAYLLSMCGGSNAGNTFISALLPTNHYIGPGDDRDSTQPCKCNTVYWAVATACATCQGQLVYADTWSGWARLCSSPVFEKWPLAIPGGTSIPAWAFLNVSTEDSGSDAFDVINAENIARNRTSDSSTPTGTSSPLYITITATTTATSQGSRKATGPIVGGVIGGIALICSAGVAVYILRRRAAARQGQNVPSSSATETLINSDKMSDASMPETRLYNPDDPSTYPGAILATVPHSNTRYPGYAEV